MAFEIENSVLVKYIEEDSVTEIVIPEGVTAIGDNAFRESDLTSITIPESVTSIGKSGFAYCRSLTNIVIPKSVTRIGDWAFRSCRSLTCITIPEGVTKIADHTFVSCESLTNIRLPESLTCIGTAAFYHCKHLADITIPESVTSIGDHSFSGCESLINIIIPEGVRSIGKRVFTFCPELRYITIPASVTSIGQDPFYQCDSLNTVMLYGIRFADDMEEIWEDDWQAAMEMLQTKDFFMELNSGVKYAAIVGFYLKTSDPDAERYIMEHLDEIIPFLIENHNPEAIHKLLETGKFVTEKNIDKFIESAIAQGNIEIQTMLIRYKAERLGFADPKAGLKL